LLIGTSEQQKGADNQPPPENFGENFFHRSCDVRLFKKQVFGLKTGDKDRYLLQIIACRAIIWFDF
jgi:hypothetical protein